MLSEPFSQHFLFCNAGRFIHFQVSLCILECSSQIIKQLSTHGNIFSAELVLAKCTQTIHVLVVETECIKFL